MNIAEEWIQELEKRFGEINYIHKIGCDDKSKPEIAVFFFHNLPDNLLTSITFGLSNAQRDEWKFGKPELIVTLDTKDKAWGLSAGYFASSFFNEKTFQYGNLFTLDSPISQESDMSGYFIFAPSFLDQKQSTIELSDRKIHLVSMYPIYQEEIELIKSKGLKYFWHMDGYDMYDVNRRNLAK